MSLFRAYRVRPRARLSRRRRYRAPDCARARMSSGIGRTSPIGFSEVFPASTLFRCRSRSVNRTSSIPGAWRISPGPPRAASITVNIASFSYIQAFLEPLSNISKFNCLQVTRRPAPPIVPASPSLTVSASRTDFPPGDGYRRAGIQRQALELPDRDASKIFQYALKKEFVDTGANKADEYGIPKPTMSSRLVICSGPFNHRKCPLGISK